MKALVTGGAGFIGSNVVAALLEEGYEVTIIDNLSTGYFKNIEQAVKENKVRFVQGDIRDMDKVLEACQGQEVVFHLAASVGRQRSLDDPALDGKINLLGTINVLEGMRICGVKRIVYSSSAAIFGELMTDTIDESHPQNADSPYGVTKLAAEKMILAYTGLYDISSVCLRYFNIYGVNQHYDLYGNVIPIFARQIAKGEPITIYGDGSQTRDFVNVLDVARANLMAATYDTKSSIFNLGSGESITIQYLAEVMQQLADKKVGIVYAPERSADVKHCKANTQKVERCMGFKTQVEMVQGLRNYLQWYMSCHE